MNKKLILLVTSLCLFILLAGGCTKNNQSAGNTATPSPSPAAANGTGATSAPTPTPLVNTVVKQDINVDDYVKLGQYKGVKVKVQPLTVTDDDIEVAIQQSLQSSGAKLTEITDGSTVKKGETVNIDYEGLKGGVAFEGGTSKGYDLLIGSNSFIPGFEDQIVGAKKGDKLTVNVTFPADYGAADLAGQAVVFNVTVNKIQKYDLTLDYVKNNTSYTTIEDYKASVKSDLEKKNQDTMKTTKENDVYNTVVSNSQIGTIPQNLLDYYSEDFKVINTNYVQSLYGVDLNTYLSQSGMTMDTFNQQAQNYAKSMATREIVLGAIIKAENITLSDSEYQTKVSEYASQYGYTSSEQFLQNADEKLLKQSILYDKVMQFLADKAVEE